MLNQRISQKFRTTFLR